jgi:pyruvate-formate lyase-activating enzyme
MCQNDEWRSRATVVMDDAELCRRYLANELTSAVVFGGLEPFEQMAELLDFAKTLREDFACDDDIVIYTGYYPGEIQVELSRLCCYKNIVVKFGRYIPGSEERYDNVLGVVLSSENQFAERVS